MLLDSQVSNFSAQPVEPHDEHPGTQDMIDMMTRGAQDTGPDSQYSAVSVDSLPLSMSLPRHADNPAGADAETQPDPHAHACAVYRASDLALLGHMSGVCGMGYGSGMGFAYAYTQTRHIHCTCTCAYACICVYPYDANSKHRQEVHA